MASGRFYIDPLFFLIALGSTAAHSATVSVIVDNDHFSQADAQYTSGVMASYLSEANDAPSWLDQASRWLPGAVSGETHAEYALGQHIYTPKDRKRTTPNPHDRPYAGWLFGSVAAITASTSQMDRLGMSIGVLGPASGAQWSQDHVHHLLRKKEFLGWNNQLKNEATLQLHAERTWRSDPYPMGPGAFDWLPRVRADVGNVRIGLTTEATLRYGKLGDDFGPLELAPNVGGAALYRSDRALYGFISGQARYVAHSIFLDGNTFRDSLSVTREPYVFGLRGGVVAVVRPLRVSFIHERISRQYAEQPGRADTFQSIVLDWAF